MLLILHSGTEMQSLSTYVMSDDMMGQMVCWANNNPAKTDFGG